MNKAKADETLKQLNFEILKIRESAKKTDEASHERLSTRPIRDDKHQIRASDLTKNYLQKLELLKKELENAPSDTPKTIKPPCLIKVVYDDGGALGLFLVKNAVSLPRTSFISVDSPLGKAVSGKAPGDTFEYVYDGGGAYSGKIIALE